MEEIEDALHVLANRDSQYRIYQRLVTQAGVSLDPSCAWLLFRIEEQSPISQIELAKRLHVPQDKLTTSIEQLRRDGLVAVTPADVPQAGKQQTVEQIGQITLTALVSKHMINSPMPTIRALLNCLMDGRRSGESTCDFITEADHELVRNDTNTQLLSNTSSSR